MSSIRCLERSDLTSRRWGFVAWIMTHSRLLAFDPQQKLLSTRGN
jgi:hypothetical protein